MTGQAGGPVEEDPGFVGAYACEADPVSCAVASAVLGEIIEPDRLANAREKSEHLRTALEPLAEKHAVTGTVRGKGLFLGLA